MAVNVIEYINKVQEEGLKSLKQSQEASLAAMSDMRKLATQFSEKPGTLPTFENVPTPAQLVELSFGFASQFLEIRKGYTIKVAELIAEAQKQVESTVKSTVSEATHQVNQVNQAAANGAQAATQTAGRK